MNTTDLTTLYVMKRGREVYFLSSGDVLPGHEMVVSFQVATPCRFWPTDLLCKAARLTTFVAIPPSAAARMNGREIHRFVADCLSGLFYYDMALHGFWLQEEQDVVALKMFLS